MSSNHVRCPLYTGEELPSTPVLAAPAPLPQGGFRGWLGGLSARDRRIYTILVGLLALIILAYIVSGFFLFTGDDTATVTPTALATAAASPTVPVAAASPTTGLVSPTTNAFATAAAKGTQTAVALGSPTKGTPTPTKGTPTPTKGTPTSSPTRSVTPSATDEPIIVAPTDEPISVPTDAPADTAIPTNVPPPTRVPPTSAVPTDSPVPTEPVVLPTITPEPPTEVVPTEPLPTSGPPATATDVPEPELPPTQPPPTDIPEPELPPTETPGGRASSVVIFFADPSGRVLVPVTRPIAPTNQPRTAAISQLIDGPGDPPVGVGLGRLVPADTRLIGLEIKNGRATANFNRLPTFGDESLTDLGLRSVILALTERTDVTEVQLQVAGRNIGGPRYRPNVNPDNPGGQNGQFSTTSFLPLYYPLAGSGHMVRVMRLVPRTQAEATATMNELIAGPGPYGDVLARPVPAGTAVERLAINGGTAELALSREFLAAGDRRAAVTSILLALTTFPSVGRVAITVDGAALDAYWGAEYAGPLGRPALNWE